MHTLDGKPVLILTAQGVPISLGRLHVIKDPLLKQIDRAELVFETETLACRLRIPQDKIEALKKTWDGHEYRYALPGGDDIWMAAPAARDA